VAQVRSSPVVPLLVALDADTETMAAQLDQSGSSGAGFFRATVGLRHNMFANLWLASVATANAIQSYAHNGTTATRRTTAMGNASLAEAAFQRIFTAQRVAESSTGKRGLYASDKLSDIHRSRRVVRQLGAFLLGLLEPQPREHLPLISYEDTGGSMYQFYDYQMEHQRSFPLLHNSSRWNLYRLVRVSCASTTNTSSDCRTSADGGRFRGTVTLQMEAIDPCPIRFETGAGTILPRTPTRGSQLYTAPIIISSSTTFKVALMCGDESEAQWLVSSLAFTREDDNASVSAPSPTPQDKD
jgi:hypothetical protein